MLDFMSQMRTMTNSIPSLPDTDNVMSSVLGMDDYIWDEENFNIAARNPSSFLTLRKRAIEALKLEIDAEYKLWMCSEKKDMLFNRIGKDGDIKKDVPHSTEFKGAGLPPNLPRKQRMNIAKQAALALYGLRMNIINETFPVKYVDKSKDRVVKGAIAKQGNIKISSDEKGEKKIKVENEINENDVKVNDANSSFV